MQTTIWIIGVVALAIVALGAMRAALRNRRRYVPAIPATISVTEPTVDTIESPRGA